jgi:hypothetical protein
VAVLRDVVPWHHSNDEARHQTRVSP